jgi:hypothetical protein
MPRRRCDAGEHHGALSDESGLESLSERVDRFRERNRRNHSAVSSPWGGQGRRDRRDAWTDQNNARSFAIAESFEAVPIQKLKHGDRTREITEIAVTERVCFE